MNDLAVKTQTPIEVALQVDENGMTTARKLYAFLELSPAHYSKWCKINISENQYAEESTDFTPFTLEGERYNPNPTTDYKLTAAFANKLAMLSKSERGEQARNYFIKVEQSLKTTVANQTAAKSQLSPQLALLTEMVSAMAQQELKVKQIEDTVSVIKDTIIQRDDDWRRSINQMFNNAVAGDGLGDFQGFRRESYDVLESRARCNLSVRLINMKNRMRDNGATKSKIEKLTKMDVIEDDQRLKEIYTAIVKEFSIKYSA